MSEQTIYSPYKKLADVWAAPNLEDVPRLVRDYLMLMPTAEFPEPIAANYNPRARLVKYLYHDDPHPLDKPLPSLAERKSIIYDPFQPVTAPDPARGYRVFTQSFVTQAQTKAQTILRIFMGDTSYVSPYESSVNLEFHILSNTTLDANTKDMAMVRTYAMEIAIIQALAGVHMTGVGTFRFYRSRMIGDDQQNVGRMLLMTFSSMGGTTTEIPPLTE